MFLNQSDLEVTQEHPTTETKESEQLKEKLEAAYEKHLKSEDQIFNLSIEIPGALLKNLHLIEYLTEQEESDKNNLDYLKENHPEIIKTISKLCKNGFEVELQTGYNTHIRKNNPQYGKTPETYQPYAMLHIFKAEEINAFENEAAFKQALFEQNCGRHRTPTKKEVLLMQSPFSPDVQKLEVKRLRSVKLKILREEVYRILVVFIIALILGPGLFLFLT